MSEEKGKKGVKKKNMIDTLCESNINTFLKNIFYRKKPSYSAIAVNLQ